MHAALAVRSAFTRPATNTYTLHQGRSYGGIDLEGYFDMSAILHGSLLLFVSLFLRSFLDPRSRLQVCRSLYAPSETIAEAYHQINTEEPPRDKARARQRQA